MKLLKSTAFASVGFVAMITMLIIRFITFFIAPFILLSIGRMLYCAVADTEFSVHWPIHGAFFLAIISTLGTVHSIATTRIEFTEGVVKKIPAIMIENAVIIFLLQFIWHGAVCFFTNKEFLIIDSIWIRQIIISLPFALLMVIWHLIKSIFSK